MGKSSEQVTAIQKLIQDSMSGVLQGYNKGIQGQFTKLIKLHQQLLRDLTIQQYITAAICSSDPSTMGDYRQHLKTATKHVDKDLAKLDEEIQDEKNKASILTVDELTKRFF